MGREGDDWTSVIAGHVGKGKRMGYTLKVESINQVESASKAFGLSIWKGEGTIFREGGRQAT